MNYKEIYLDAVIDGKEGDLTLQCFYTIEWRRDTDHEEPYRFITDLDIYDYDFIGEEFSFYGKTIERYVKENIEIIKRKLLES